MREQLFILIQWFLLAGGALGSFYLIAATIVVLRFTRRSRAFQRGADRNVPAIPVTVLKPLCGAEPELYENLRSYCLQSHTALQLVFGVQNPRDPAIAVVERLRTEFPDVDISLVVQQGWAAGNRKVANLHNMLPGAKHDILIMADADIRVGPHSIGDLVAELSKPGVGLVTCLYRARPVAGFWSRLAASHIDHGFLPMALVGGALGAGSGCFGATVAMRKSTLAAIGGFITIAHRLADDHALGKAVRAKGLRVALASDLVDTIVAEPSLRALFRHELRWARTIRALAPAGFVGTSITHPLLLASLGCLLSGCSVASTALVGWVLLCRCAMARTTDIALHLPRAPLWQVPIRDLLSFAVFLTSFFARTVAWRDQRVQIGRGDELIQSGP